MALPRARRGLSLAQQAIGLRSSYPAAKITLVPARVTWVGLIRPTPLSRDYKVKITYQLGRFPNVVVLDPLEYRPGEDLPHTYQDGSLCLHETDEWTPAMHIADTTVPWASEWLAHYEVWKIGGRWYGDGDNPDLAGSAAMPLTEMSTAQLDLMATTTTVAASSAGGGRLRTSL